MRRYGSGVGRCHPTREERGGENESLCPSTFMWVRGGMNSPLGSHWKEFFTQAQLEIMGEESQQKHTRVNFNAPTHGNCSNQVYDVSLWLLLAWHIECYCFHLPLSPNRAFDTFARLHVRKREAYLTETSLHLLYFWQELYLGKYHLLKTMEFLSISRNTISDKW